MYPIYPAIFTRNASFLLSVQSAPVLDPTNMRIVLSNVDHHLASIAVRTKWPTQCSYPYL